MEEVWQRSGSYVVEFASCCRKFDVGTIKGLLNVPRNERTLPFLQLLLYA
jgi:hypothetical protein